MEATIWGLGFRGVIIEIMEKRMETIGIIKGL